jgi:hypothetical protein
MGTLGLVELPVTSADDAGLCRFQGLDKRWGLCLSSGRRVIPAIYVRLDPCSLDPLTKKMGWQSYNEEGVRGQLITVEHVAHSRAIDQTTREQLSRLPLFSPLIKLDR